CARWSAANFDYW
nr:immunoglobulin heavy chain junction region [Macaca mulatta]MOV52847.1 immunoglobulin heavy chain junction region [Macaca mulatta]MOV53184.1 immunoglobulin heavy chain junction region [Macaca mulatta]MOX58938.1 immunoglobulin heavy chain junction region [Macaca mulatta]MOX59020.1 immunoglobulin heavy chain junction region [Macaca mulatta]